MYGCRWPEFTRSRTPSRQRSLPPPFDNDLASVSYRGKATPHTTQKPRQQLVTGCPRPTKTENKMSQGTLVIEINYNFKSDRLPPSLTQIRKHLDALKRHEYEYLKITDHECNEKEEGDY